MYFNWSQYENEVLSKSTIKINEIEEDIDFFCQVKEYEKGLKYLE